MKSPIVDELRYKVFKSGNPLFLFIGLNVIVFLVINLVALFEFILNTGGFLSSFMQLQLALPASLGDLVYKPWTLITYMFTQREFFHMLFNMLWLFWLGRIFLEFLNKRQFIFTYIAGGLAGAITFLILYNTLPVFAGDIHRSVLIGASASVTAIIVSSAVLVPHYSIRLLFFGNVKIVYLAIAFIVLSLLGIGGDNSGGNIAHLGGALLGYLYITRLNKGSDWSTWFTRKKKKHPFKVYKNKAPVSPERSSSDQAYIDSILDKILQSGYKSLTKAEKDALFNASKEDKGKYK
ncbi:MAG TPA: rhomboid family intramembrane serine protease [Sphingobacteriaceae bacterium]|nr:rhomboid family intramembrane serine protease [Sphingobacteriaceae bacterium]